MRGMKTQKINKLHTVIVVLLLVCGLSLAIGINTVASGKISVQTIQYGVPETPEPMLPPTTTPSPTPTPTPQPTSGTSTFSMLMSDFDILGFARLILIALGIMWVIIVLRALDKNFGKKKPAQ
jgi:hypothetical protein